MHQRAPPRPFPGDAPEGLSWWQSRWARSRRRRSARVDKPRPIGIARQRLRRDLNRQSGLPDATCAGQRRHPRLPEQLRQLDQLAIAPDELGHLRWQVPRECIQGLQRREVSRQVGMRGLEDTLRVCKSRRRNRRGLASAPLSSGGMPNGSSFSGHVERSIRKALSRIPEGLIPSNASFAANQ